MTKKYKALSFIFGLLSFLSIWLPAAVFIIIAAVNGEIGSDNGLKLGLSATFVIILSILSFVFKYHWRTPSVLVLMALYLFAKNFGIILLVVGSCIVLDELCLTPLHKKFKELYVINKQMDKRGV